MRYTAMTTQMAVIILLAVLGGKKLDAWYPRDFPLFTLITSIAGVVVAIYFVIKDLIRINRIE